MSKQPCQWLADSNGPQSSVKSKTSCVQDQEAASWDRQTLFELVQRQSLLLGHMLHLVHSRPAFPLSQTARSFWPKLAASLQSSQLVGSAELQLLTTLAGKGSIRVCPESDINVCVGMPCMFSQLLP